MEKTQLIFIPWPTMGHFAQILELAKLIINRDIRFSITILVMQVPDFIDSNGSAAIDSLITSTTIKGLHFHRLPHTNPTPEWSSRTRGYFISKMIENHKSHVKIFIENFHKRLSPTPKLGGFVVDMLCTNMIDVADSFGLPSFVFFSSGAGFLSLMLYFQTVQDDLNQDVTEWSRSHNPLVIESFSNPIPSRVLPIVFTNKDSWLGRFLHYARQYRKAKGILINTFVELEQMPLNSLMKQKDENFTQIVPRIYPIGPILNQIQQGSNDVRSNIISWLNEQPPGSVVYICFGSQGGLEKDQVKELAYGLECSGYRFLWSLRTPSKEAGFPSEYVNYEEVLPEGFLERTSRTGKVVGWVPQLDILSNAAVGCFVSHCGWNSILESIWFGVPIATWPLHSEQQLNAFQLVKELGLAVEITLDYQERREGQKIVTAEAIERGIKRVMQLQNEKEAMEKVKAMKDRSRLSMAPEGSSYGSLGQFIEQILSGTKKGKVNGEY